MTKHSIAYRLLFVSHFTSISSEASTKPRYYKIVQVSCQIPHHYMSNTSLYALGNIQQLNFNFFIKKNYPICVRHSLNGHGIQLHLAYTGWDTLKARSFNYFIFSTFILLFFPLKIKGRVF
jgi:hypothetical protein